MRPRFHSLIRIAPALLGFAALSAFSGCQTVYHGNLDSGHHEAGVKLRRLVLLPLDNATSDPSAARALRDFTASALAERGLRFRQTEESLIASAKKSAAGEAGLYPELARLTGARYFLAGTVHEYRYMSDLEGSPALGYTLRLIDSRDGRTLWTGSAANTGYGWQSLSELSADSARKLVAEIPLVMRDEAALPRTCLRTGKPAHYTATGKQGIYEVDTDDGTLSYTVAIKDEKLPPIHPDYAKLAPAPEQPIDIKSITFDLLSVVGLEPSAKEAPAPADAAKPAEDPRKEQPKTEPAK